MFQRQVNTDPAFAISGDFAGANPRSSMLAMAGQLVAGAAGVIVGRFARARIDNGVVSNNDPGVASRLGFVHRDQPSIITAFLGEATLLIPAGLDMTMHDAGDFWCLFAAGGSVGQKAFAAYADGAAVAGAASSTVPGASFTASAGASFTGVIAANTLTASAVTGVLHVGDVIAGAGVTVGTTITAILTGTGGAGTYTIGGAPQTVASEAMTSTSLFMDVTAVASGVLNVGDPISGTNVNAGQKITSAVAPAAGGVGVYGITAADSFASTTVTAAGALESQFYLHTACGAGELAMISTRPVIS